MLAEQFKAYMNELFGQLLIDFNEDDEYGYCNFSKEMYKVIGYATNITPEVIEQAAEANVDLLITHHDAWEFVYGMKERCVELLKEHEIAHFYVHLPLDYAEFGTCNSLLKLLGVQSLIQQSQHINGDSSIGIGAFQTPVSFDQLVDRMTSLLGEKVFYQKNNDKEIRTVGILTGAGNGTEQLREALSGNCDVYITGEKTLYTVQYAKFIKMNIIVGSHTFTEIFGVKSLAHKIKERFNHVEIIQIQEEHDEVME